MQRFIPAHGPLGNMLSDASGSVRELLREAFTSGTGPLAQPSTLRPAPSVRV